MRISDWSSDVCSSDLGTVSLNWVLPFKLAEGDVVFNSDIYMTADFGGQNGENLPGYTATNVRLDWNNVAGTGLDLGGYVRNLFGKPYYVSQTVMLLNFQYSFVSVGQLRTCSTMAGYRL